MKSQLRILLIVVVIATISLFGSAAAQETAPSTGHAYEYVETGDITWQEAREAASERTYNGKQGYLVTITSEAEQEFVESLTTQRAWIGASDAADEGTWRWVTGPEGEENNGQGRHFFTQSGDGGTPVNGQYTDWNPGEPNAANAQENYAQLWNESTAWNDNNGANGQGYIVEYGGLEADRDVQKSDVNEDTTQPSIEVISVSNRVTNLPKVTFKISDETGIKADDAVVKYGEGGPLSDYGSQTKLVHIGGDQYRATLFDSEEDTRSLGDIQYQITVSDVVGNTATHSDTLTVKPVAHHAGRFVGLSVGTKPSNDNYETSIIEDQIASQTFDTGTRAAISKLTAKAGVSGGASIAAAAGKLAGLGVGILFSVPSANPPSQIKIDTLGGTRSQETPFTTDTTYNQDQPVFVAISRTNGVETYSQVRVTVQPEGEVERVVREYDALAFPSSEPSEEVPRGNILIPKEPLSFEEGTYGHHLQPGEEKQYTIRAYLWKGETESLKHVGKASKQITITGTEKKNSNSVDGRDTEDNTNPEQGSEEDGSTTGTNPEQGSEEDGSTMESQSGSSESGGIIQDILSDIFFTSRSITGVESLF